jgi:hypothetical protein
MDAVLDTWQDILIFFYPRLYAPGLLEVSLALCIPQDSLASMQSFSSLMEGEALLYIMGIAHPLPKGNDLDLIFKNPLLFTFQSVDQVDKILSPKCISRLLLFSGDSRLLRSLKPRPWSVLLTIVSGVCTKMPSNK